MSPEDEKMFEANRRANSLRVQRALPPRAPKQSFFNKVRDQFDANTQADQYRRQQAGQARMFGDQLKSENTNAGAHWLNAAKDATIGHYQSLGEGLSTAFGEGDKLRSYEAQTQQENLNHVENLRKQLASPGTSLADRAALRSRLKIASDASQASYNRLIQQNKDLQEKADPRKQAGNIIQIGADLAGLGVAGFAGKEFGVNAAKLGFKEAVKRAAPAVGQNFVLNTAQGAAGEIQSGKPSIKGAIEKGLVGGATGAIADFALGGFSGLMSYSAYKNVVKELAGETDGAVVRDTVQHIAGDLPEETITKISKEITDATDEATVDSIIKKAAQEEAGIATPKVPATADTPLPDTPVAKNLIDGFKQAKTPQQARDSVKVLFPELDDKTVNKVAQDLAKAQDDNTINKILQDAQASRKAVTEGVDNATPTGDVAPTPEQQLAEQAQIQPTAPIVSKQAPDADIQANQVVQSVDEAGTPVSAVQDAVDPLESLKQEARTDTSKLATNVLKNEEIVRSVMNGGVFKMRLDNGKVVAFGDKTLLSRLGNDVGSDVTDIIPVSIGRGKSGKASTGQPRLILENQNALIQLKQALGETTEKKQTVTERLREKWGEPTTQSQPPKSTPTKPKVTEAEVVANQNNRHFEGSSADRPLPDYKAGDKVSTYTMYGEVSGVLKKVPDYNKSHLIKGNDFVVKLDKPLELPNERGTLKEIVTDGRDFKTIKKATPESSVVANPNSITEKPSTPKTVEAKPTVREKVKTQKAPTYGLSRPELEGKLSPRDAFVQAGIDSGHNGLAGTGKGAKAGASINDLTESQKQYVEKSATSYYLSGDPVFQERVKAYARSEAKPSPFEKDLQTAGLAPKTVEAKDTRKANQAITPEAQATADIVVPETVTNAETLSGQFQKQAVDKDANYINYLKKVEKETGQTGLVDQFYYDSGLQRRSNSIANNQTTNSQNLSQAFEGLTGDAKNQFDEYVTVRNELANAQRGLKTKDSIQALQAREAQLAGQYGERFAALNNYYKEWAGRLREAGIIDEPTFQSFVKNDDYTHIQRVMDDLAGYSSGGGSSFSLGTTKARLKRKGSERAVQPADITALNYAQKMQSEIQRNQTASNIIDVLVEQGHAKQLPAGQATNKNAIRRIVNGKTEIFQVPRDIKEIADQITPFQLGTLGKIVAAPQRVLRAGATGLSAPFTAANYIKDQAGVAVLSKDLAATSLNPKNAAEGLFRAAQETLGGTIDDPVWQKFIAAGGDTTSYDFLRNVKDSNRMSREIRLGVKGKYANKVDSVGSVVRTLEDLNSITERATRFQSFKGVYDKVLKQTGNESEALRAATLASWQNSVDFSRMGNTAQAINLLIPYFNAGIQGTRLLGRRLGEAPVATSMKALGFVAMPILGATLYNLADPERRAVYDNISDYEKQNNVIIVLPGAKQQADGTYDNVIKIPLQKGLVNLAQPFRMQAENFAGKADQNEISQMSQQFFGAFAGPLETGSIRGFAGGLVPQVAKPIVQQAMNKDLYTGKEIVPDYVNNATDAQGNPIPESKKAYDFTSGTARAIGGRLGVSPLRVEKLIKDTTSKTGLYTLNAADNALAKLGKIPDSQIGGLSVKDDISRRFTKAQGNYNFKKSAGGKYYDLVKDATKNLNVNEKNAYNALHPSKTNFLGEDIFDENKRLTKYARAGLYLQNPKVFAADKAIEMQMRKQGSPANPLYDLPQDQLTKSLLKDALPPGAKDDELSNLYKQEWYQDFKNKQSAYYTQLKSKLEKEGKTMPKSANPYPTTPPELQKAMDSYSALPKGTGARSGWIKANPTIWKSMTDQWGAVDAWENKERVAMGLSPLDNTQSSSGGGKFGYGKGSSSKKDKTPKTYIGTLLGDVPKISSNEIAIRTTPKRAKFKAQLPGGKGRNYKKIKLS